MNAKQTSALTIINANGSVVTQQTLQPATTDYRLDTSAYPTGVYMYQCGTQSGKFVVK